VPRRTSRKRPKRDQAKTKNPNAVKSRLNGGFVGDGVEGLGGVVGRRNVVGLTGLSGLSLQVDVFCRGREILGNGETRFSSRDRLTTLGLGFLLGDGVGLDTVQELLSASGVLDVFNPQVDSLLHVSAVDNLVTDDTDTSGGNVVDDTGLAVVVLVGHTLLFRRVGLDVDNVTDLVGGQEGGHVGHTMVCKA
jgi:hypothetical protein